jgi:hypothetical protein
LGRCGAGHGPIMEERAQPWKRAARSVALSRRPRSLRPSRALDTLLRPVSKTKRSPASSRGTCVDQVPGAMRRNSSAQIPS